MNYFTEERRHALAAEYVLGTLRGKARLRFQKLMMNSQLLTETTWMWEQYLNNLGNTIAPVPPPARVWQQIEQRLGFVEPDAPSLSLIQRLKQRSTIWQGVSGFAAAAAIVLAVLLITQAPTPVSPVTQIAVVNDQDANPLWLIEVSSTTLDVRTTANLTARADKDYELWMVPANGEAPISLGVLPESGSWQRPTPAILLNNSVSALAVSLEPPGGSPTGSPTEVLYISPLNAV